MSNKKHFMATYVEDGIHSRLCLYREAEKTSLAAIIKKRLVEFSKKTNHEALLKKVRERCVIEFRTLQLDGVVTNWNEYKKYKMLDLSDSGICNPDILQIFNFEFSDK